MSKGVWVRSDIEVNPGEILYFFHPADGGGGQTWITMCEDGTVSFGGDRNIVIKDNGAIVTIKNAADLVI